MIKLAIRLKSCCSHTNILLSEVFWEIFTQFSEYFYLDDYFIFSKYWCYLLSFSFKLISFHYSSVNLQYKKQFTMKKSKYMSTSLKFFTDTESKDSTLEVKQFSFNDNFMYFYLACFCKRALKILKMIYSESNG